MMRMMNKKGFGLQGFILSTVLFSAVIALFILSVGSLGAQYDNTGIVDSQFEEDFEKFEDSTDRVNDIFEEVNSEEGLSFVGTFDILFKATFSVISLVFGGLIIAGQQVASMGDYLGLPRVVSNVLLTTLIAGLTIFIVFRVISSVSRRDL